MSISPLKDLPNIVIDGHFLSSGCLWVPVHTRLPIDFSAMTSPGSRASSEPQTHSASQPVYGDPGPSSSDEPSSSEVVGGIRPSQITSWFDDPNSVEHPLLQPLGTMRALLSHYIHGTRISSVEVPPEEELLSRLSSLLSELTVLVDEATETLFHPDLLNWFADRDWGENKSTFLNMAMVARYLHLDIVYASEMLDQWIGGVGDMQTTGTGRAARPRLPQRRGIATLDMEQTRQQAMAIRKGLDGVEKVVYLAYKTMKGHLETLQVVFAEAFGIDLGSEEDDCAFWGRRE